MATSVKKPVAKSNGTRALTVWEQRMADAATKSAKAEKAVSGLKGISIRGGILTVDEQPVPGNELDVVVLVAAHENQYYTSAYNPDKASIPACYAFGDPDAEDPEGEMKPHEQAEDPQGDDNGLCSNCWANAMGSAEVGRGKACKNVRRLAMITADTLENSADVHDAEVRVLKVPVMSVKGWALYVRNQLSEELKRPYWGVVTTVKVVPDKKSQFRVTFAFKELIDFTDELYEAIEKKINEIKPQLTTPYAKMEEEEAPPARGRGGPLQRQTPNKPQPMKVVGKAAQAMQKVVAKKAKY
jgi:hypothetical protein